MPASKPAMLSDVMPNSSAWIVAKIAHSTACAHRESPSTTAGASGSLENTSGRIVSASGPAGYVERRPVSWLVSLDHPSHCPASNAAWIAAGSANGRTSHVRPRRAASAAALPSVVVPCVTQTITLSMSEMDVNPLSAATIIP